MCENSRIIYTIATINTLLLHYKYHTNQHTNKHFLSSFSVPRWTRERKIVNKYIYQSYNKDYYNNNPYTMGIFSCPCCVSGWCASRVPGGLLKLSQHGSYWKPGRNWQAGRSRQAGRYWQAGRSWMVSEAERYWGMFCRKNNGGICGVVLWWE